MPSRAIDSVLFVCTGNIFRSLTADYALRRALGPGSPITVASAGTQDFPHVVRPYVREYLAQAHGLDVAAHRRRTLRTDMLAPRTLVVAMSTDHLAHIRDRLGHRDVLLFSQACGLPPVGMPDIEDVVDDHENNLDQTNAFIRKTIDHIVSLIPQMAQRI
jgi:protein-tyrosine phosphatase